MTATDDEGTVYYAATDDPPADALRIAWDEGDYELAHLVRCQLIDVTGDRDVVLGHRWVVSLSHEAAGAILTPEELGRVAGWLLKAREAAMALDAEEVL